MTSQKENGIAKTVLEGFKKNNPQTFKINCRDLGKKYQIPPIRFWAILKLLESSGKIKIEDDLKNYSNTITVL